MKLIDLFEVDRGDLYLQQTADRNAAMKTPQGRDAAFADAARRARAMDQATMATGQVWLIDRASGKRLAGPFKDEDAAMSFKTNRKDRIPADARIARV